MTRRQVKFALLTWLVLPVGKIVLRALVATYRLDEASRAALLAQFQSGRAVVVTYHGMMFALLAGARFMRKRGRVLCVMTSPSRDGQLLDAAITAFGMQVVKGSSKSKAIEGSRSLIEAVAAGSIGVLASDGPRGPRAAAKPGFIGVSRAGGAAVYTAAAGSARSWKLRSWDRMFIPPPFSMIKIRTAPFEFTESESRDEILKRIDDQLHEDARAVNSPVIEGLE